MPDKKVIKRINPIEGMLKTYESIANSIATGQQPYREDAINDKIGDNIVVDTVVPQDIDMWETAVKRNGEWTVVEQYPNYEEALNGHERWVRAMQENPEQELKDIKVWGIGL